MSASFEPSLTADVERLYSPLFLYGISSPEVGEEFDAIGAEEGARFFGTRAAPVGAVSAPAVVAMFYNFSPAIVGFFIPALWERLTPAQLLAAQERGVARSLTRALAGVDASSIDEATTLLRVAVDAAAAHPEGRPLFAAHAALPWPQDPLIAFWRAHTVLREFRGDGHIAVLLGAGLSGLDALVLHCALMPQLTRFFKATRGWSDAEWGDAVARLRADDVLTDADDLTLTDRGVSLRREIEERTNVLNAPAYAALGVQGCQRLLELGAPISDALAAGWERRFVRTLIPSA